MVSLGCAKNLVDSEVMLGVLKDKGFRLVADETQADLIVVNTCAFLQSAVEEGIDRILELSELKSEGRLKRLIVAGCMVERYRGDLEKSLPEVDRFLSIDELLSVADTSATTDACLEEARRPYFLYDETMPRVQSTTGAQAYVKVAEGCNRPCAFCIIPKLRGTLRSRPASSILSEAQQLVTSGVRELTLVAQDLTAYGTDLVAASPESDDLGALAEAGDPFWVRLLYAYPIGVNEKLLQTIIESKVVCNYLDIPLQHISAAVLKRMKRPLGAKGTRRLVEMMRAGFPEISLRTTFVVGFPGETEADVAELEEFILQGHFEHLGIFPYSQEEEAASYTFDEQVAPELAIERRDRLMAAQQKVVFERLANSIGQKRRVLIDGEHKETELLLSARSETQGPEGDGITIINDADRNEQLVGRFGMVEITETAGYDLVGTLESVE
ncbi:UNVERIFIED_CONTAM: hypothetical protein GTU68_044751 [Idotea baltica]|nr:hypothetical protein [Idotea baltica]